MRGGLSVRVHEDYPKATQSASRWTLPVSPPYMPLNSFEQHETTLCKAQRVMSCKTKFSNNWKTAKAHVQKTHSCNDNARRDYRYKTSSTISQNHAMVCIEDLQVRNMSKSASDFRQRKWRAGPDHAPATFAGGNGE